MTPESRKRIDAALAAARDTRVLEIGPGALAAVPKVFARQFPRKRAVVVGDTSTMRVAGSSIAPMFDGLPPFVFEDADLYAEHRFVERLTESLAAHDAIPIAVGSGTINDVVKLAAHRTGRQYLCVATAASMDGYTAYGSSITYKGSKQTFDCPAPCAVIADIDIIRAAPSDLTASGYADLLSKLTAGADWILADRLGEEPIDAKAWSTVQDNLPLAISDPAGARKGDPDAIERLTVGLMMGGFAMQATMTSRPASGAEHQFSHLWDMQHHTHNGVAPSHGFKVGVATLAVARLYETLQQMPLERLDIDDAVARWPTWPQTERRIAELFDISELREKAIVESKAKYIDADDVRQQLVKLKKIAPVMKQTLAAYLPAATKIEGMLLDVGAPTSSESIGISQERLRESFRLAYHIRRRFTVLDVAERAGLLDASLAKMFDSSPLSPVSRGEG
jgi:glycerol-1-phosphate dehydrogenase [NAD(P)+]